MSYSIIRPKDRDAWLEERKKGIGSSDAGTIMGVSPFNTPLRLWRQKLGIDPPTPESEAMRNGHFLEPAVAEYFASVTRSVIDPSSVGDWLAVNDARPHLRVSPDRLFWPEGAAQTAANRLILEIKSTSKIVDPENLPLYWICQVQYQMGVMGIPMAAIAWVTGAPRLSMGHAWVPFNPAFFETLTGAIDRFWNENVLKGVQPDPIDADDVKIKWPLSSDKKIVTATEGDYENCLERTRIEGEIKQLQEQLGEVETRIKLRIADGEALVYTDPETGKATTIARFKNINETIFHEEKLKKERPEEYAKYVKQYFDKKLFSEEDKELYNEYSSKEKGYRRFSVYVS